jgi:hypothetical protein
VALNFMQRMSGIASLTRQMVDAVQVGCWVWVFGWATWGWMQPAAQQGAAVLLPGLLAC